MPRFVLLRHDCPPGFAKPSHWDFMLEADGDLLTWELRDLPSAWGGSGRDSVKAFQLPNHRLTYLDYEGPISGDRGSVRRIAGGTFESRVHSEQKIRAVLDSPTIRGLIELIRTGDDWQLVIAIHDEA